MLNIFHHPSQFNFDQSWIPSPHFILSIAQPKILSLIKILADLPAAKARVSRFKTCKVTAHLPQSLNLPPFLQCFVNSACIALPGLGPSHNQCLVALCIALHAIIALSLPLHCFTLALSSSLYCLLLHTCTASLALLPDLGPACSVWLHSTLSIKYNYGWQYKYVHVCTNQR